MTFEEYILKERPICQLPLCCNPSTVVLDPHKKTMLAVCRTHADLDEAQDDFDCEKQSVQQESA